MGLGFGRGKVKGAGIGVLVHCASWAVADDAKGTHAGRPKDALQVMRECVEGGVHPRTWPDKSAARMRGEGRGSSPLRWSGDRAIVERSWRGSNPDGRSAGAIAEHGMLSCTCTTARSHWTRSTLGSNPHCWRVE